MSFFLLAPETPAQTTVDLGRQSRNVDFGQAPFTRPAQTGGSLPATCTVGELYFHTGAMAGSNLYGCTAPNTWTSLGGSASLTLATQAEAEQGIENTHYMSPLRSAQAIAAQCALPRQSGHAGKILRTDGSTASWTPFLSLTPSAAQAITAASDSISANAMNVRISPNNHYILTSTPTIADGVDGQLLLISNNSESFSVTLQDESLLANSNLRLGGVNVTIGPRGSLLLTYNTALASWVRADTVAGGGGGSAVWGSIAGTLSNQTDLQSALDGKAGVDHTHDASDVTSGVFGLARGGTNQSSWTAGKCVQVSSDGTRLESAAAACGTGSGGEVDWILYRAARCQNTVAGAGFSTPATGAPTPVCVEGSNTLYGVLQFAHTATQSVQDHFTLPASVTSVDLYGKWRTSATSGSVVWQIQTACVADGETGDPSWNTAQTITDATKGSAWQFNDFSLTGLTLTGCSAGETMFFRFFRNPAHGSDTIGVTAELIDLRFRVAR